MAMYPCLLKPNLTFPTLTGSIVTFNSQYAGLPLKSHKAALTATQSGSGTPSPVNERPIIGYSAIGVSATGLNLWGGKALLYSFMHANIESPIVDEINNTITFSSYGVRNASILGTGQFKPNTLYTLLLTIEKGNDATSSNLVMQYSDGTTEYFGLPTAQAGLKQFFAVKTNPNKTFIGLAGYNQSSTTKIYCDECCVLEGDKTTNDFVPFGTFAIINLGGTYYFGEYDARTGVFKATHGFDTYDGSADETWDAFNIDLRMGVRGRTTANKSYVDSNICNIFDNSTSNETYADEANSYTWRSSPYVSNLVFFYVPLSENIISVEQWRTWLSNHPTTICYELATPTTIQLPPCPIDTLEGVNNIWADTGETTLQYPKFG